MVGTIIMQLMKDATMEEIEAAGMTPYFVDHGKGVYPCDANGTPYNAFSIQVKGDPIADLVEDMAAEQKARVVYDNILRMVDDPDVIDPIRFLRAREVVHFQRFGEALRFVQEKVAEKKYY